MYFVLYHSYQDCPIDFHMLHSELIHDHEIVMACRTRYCRNLNDHWVREIEA